MSFSCSKSKLSILCTAGNQNCSMFSQKILGSKQYFLRPNPYFLKSKIWNITAIEKCRFSIILFTRTNSPFEIVQNVKYLNWKFTLYKMKLTQDNVSVAIKFSRKKSLVYWLETLSSKNDEVISDFLIIRVISFAVWMPGGCGSQIPGKSDYKKTCDTCPRTRHKK